MRVRRKRDRGRYDRETIDAILDEGLIAHVGIVGEDGQPFVIPTLHARRGDLVYLPRRGREPHAARARERRRRCA